MKKERDEIIDEVIVDKESEIIEEEIEKPWYKKAFSKVKKNAPKLLIAAAGGALAYNLGKSKGYTNGVSDSVMFTDLSEETEDDNTHISNDNITE